MCDIIEKTSVFIILCKVVNKSSKLNTLLFYLHKNLYTLEKTGIIKLKFGENIVALGFEIYSFSI